MQSLSFVTKFPTHFCASALLRAASAMGRDLPQGIYPNGEKFRAGIKRGGKSVFGPSRATVRWAQFVRSRREEHIPHVQNLPASTLADIMVCLILLFHKRNATTWRLWQRGTFSFSTVGLGISSDSSNSAAHSLLVMVCWITLFHKRNSTTWRLWQWGTFSF